MTKMFNIAAVLPHGLVVLFELDGEDVIGLITGYKNGKYEVHTERDRNVELTASRLTSYQLQGPSAQSSSSERRSYLAELRSSILSKSESVNLQELWEVASSEQKEYTERELAELTFASASPIELIAIKHSLLIERTFFKRGKIGFLPRSEDDIVQIRRSQEAVARKRSEQQNVIATLKERMSGTLSPLEGSATYHIESLQELALHGDSADLSRKKDAIELVQAIKAELNLELRGDLHEQAHAILVKSRVWPQRQSLPLLRHGVPTTFKAEILAAIEQLPRIPNSSVSYRDCRALEVLTIDDEKTLDIDDGLSVEPIIDGYRFGIHVTDVSSFLQPGTPLDAVGCQRATSIYCPDVSVHMLPPELSEHRLSLLPGEERFALSLFITTDRNYTITSWEFSPTIICSKRRLTYDEVDDLLENEEETLLALYNLTSSHEAERYRLGGIKISKREALVQVNSDDSLTLQVIDDASAARNLVSETMIIYNRLAAELCAQSEIALPFRGQEPPDSQTEPQLPPGPALDYALRVRLKRSSVGSHPARHYTLGIPCYTQATSPLRRYLDLCTQRQLISAVATGAPAYSRDEIDHLISITEPPLSRAQAASREARRFWYLAYLEDRKRSNDVITGTIVRLDEGRGISVELDEVFQSFTVKGVRSATLGQTISLRITKVDPFGEYIRLDPV